MKYVAFLPLVLLFHANASAEVPLRQRSVDLVILQDGTRLLGTAVSDERGKDLQMLLRGAWLKQNAPKLLDSIEPDSRPAVSGETMVAMVRKHVDELKNQPDSNVRKIGYLEERLIDLEGELKPDTSKTPDLVVVSIPSKLIRRKMMQKPGDRNLAGLGILNQLPNVEDLHKADVTAELRKIPVNNLLRQIPNQSEATGSFTQPTVDHEFLKLLARTDRVVGKTCRLIHLSGEYVSETNANAANLQGLAAKLMVGQFEAQLQNLLSENFAKPAGKMTNRSVAMQKILPAEASAIANQQQADVVELTEMNFDIAGGSAGVQIGLYYQHADDSGWILVTSVAGNATSRDVTADQQQRITDSPTVKQVTQMFSGISSSANITNAISLGAAVEVAQQRAQTALNDALSPGANTKLAGLTILRGSVPQPAPAN